MQTRGLLAYFVGFETEAVMLAYDDEKDKVIRLTAARVNHGNGLYDPHEGDSFQDRVPYYIIPKASNAKDVSNEEAEQQDMSSLRNDA
jgi:hypothetical protein